MSNNIEVSILKDNSNNIIQSNDNENNIQENRSIEIYKTKFLKIPYFYFGNTLNFYFPFTKISEEEFKYPIFSLGSERKIIPFIYFYISIIFLLAYFLLNKFFYSKLFKFGFPFLHIIIIIFSIILYLINPGVVYKSESSNLINKNKCVICGIIYNQNLRIKHCNLCNVCIYGYDHHCGVIGKCVGKKNFVIFIFTFSLL